MLKKLFGLGAFVACSLLLAGCNTSSSGSANSSADRAAKEAKDAKDKAERELRDKESTEKSKAEKDAKDKEAGSNLATARAEETAKLAKAKEEINKLFDLPKVEAVIGTLPADKKPIAEAKLTEFKKQWGEFMKDAKNAAKMSDWKETLKKTYGELTKAAGL